MRWIYNINIWLVVTDRKQSIWLIIAMYRRPVEYILSAQYDTRVWPAFRDLCAGENLQVILQESPDKEKR